MTLWWSVTDYCAAYFVSQKAVIFMKNAMKLTGHTYISYSLSSACKKKNWGGWEVTCLTAEIADTLAEKLVTVECDSVSDLVGSVEGRARKQ